MKPALPGPARASSPGPQMLPGSWKALCAGHGADRVAGVDRPPAATASIQGLPDASRRRPIRSCTRIWRLSLAPSVKKRPSSRPVRRRRWRVHFWHRWGRYQMRPQAPRRGGQAPSSRRQPTALLEAHFQRRRRFSYLHESFVVRHDCGLFSVRIWPLSLWHQTDKLTAKG